MAHIALTIKLLWCLISLSSCYHLYIVCAITSPHVSFSLTHRDAESSPLRSVDADPADLPEDMPMRAFVAAGRALRGRVRKGGHPLVRKLSYGGGEFFLTVPVGTPSQKMIFIVDSGSELIWIQASPCPNCTYTPAPRFVYHRSSSFLPISAKSSLCVGSAGFTQTPACYNTAPPTLCGFAVRYLDQSGECGFLSIDSFDLGPKISKPFVFGSATFVLETTALAASGLMGVDKGPFSFPSQLFSGNPRMPKKFAYCLPDLTKSWTGRIEFGNYKRPARVMYTPLVVPPSSEPGSMAYFVELQGITIGQSRQIKGDMGSTIFDSGTAATRLVKPLYDMVVGEIWRQTAHLKPFNASQSELNSDLCYKVAVKAKELPKVPRIRMHFAGGVDLELGAGSILLPDQIKGDHTSIYFCIAFSSQPAGNDNIIGSYQQQNYWLEHNLETSSLGLAKVTSCAKYD